MTNGDILPPGSAFGSYEIVRLLGRGSFGSVYEALKMPLRRRVALKVLHQNFVADGNVVGRFLREAEAAASLRHPHIVETFDVDVYDGLPFIAMEFLEGESLKARIDRTRGLDVTAAVDVMLPVLSAMARVHEQGIVHRDLKPDNLFLEIRLGAVHPKVLDFGIAKAEDNRNLSVVGSKLGSPLYMSPEQHEGETVDHRTDLWSLGAILFQCLTGRVPFPGNTLPQVYRAVTTEPTPTLRLFNPAIPAQVEAVVLRALAKRPAERWASAREMGAALLPYASPVLQHTLQQEFPHVAAQHEAMAATTVASDFHYDAASAPAMHASQPPPPPTPRWASASHPPSGAYASVPYALGASNPAFASQVGPGYTGVSTVEGTSPPVAPKRSLLPLLLAVSMLLALLAGVAALVTRLRVDTRPATAPAALRPVVVEVVPDTASLQLDDEPPVVGRLSRALPDDARPHTLRVTAPGYVSQTMSFLSAAPPPARVVLAAINPTSEALAPDAGAPPTEVPAATTEVPEVGRPAAVTHRRGGRGVHRRNQVGNL